MSDPSNPDHLDLEMRVGGVLNGKWQLVRLIGAGGMAAVYAARHRNGKRAAIKVLHPALAADREIVARFLKEGYLANAVEHPGAVSVLDDDTTDDGLVFLVMELLEGNSVDALAVAQSGGRLGVDQVMAIADALLDILAAAHDKGIVHRDLKPENLFLTTGGELRVLDFGIARMRQQSSEPRATVSGHAMGTPAFMPPEQALGDWDAVDHRTDLWAVGATMFTLLTGRCVHEGETVRRVLLSAMTEEAPPLASLRPDVPEAMARVVDRALCMQRDARWPDARAMQAALRGAREGPVEATAATLASGQSLGVASPPRHGAPVVTTVPVSVDSKRVPPRRRRGLVGLGLAGLGLVGLVGITVLAIADGLFLRAEPAKDADPSPGPAAPLAHSNDHPAGAEPQPEGEAKAAPTAPERSKPDERPAASATPASSASAHALADPPAPPIPVAKPTPSGPHVASPPPAPEPPRPQPPPAPTTFKGRF